MAAVGPSNADWKPDEASEKQIQTPAQVTQSALLTETDTPKKHLLEEALLCSCSLSFSVLLQRTSLMLSVLFPKLYQTWFDWTVIARADYIDFILTSSDTGEYIL